MQTERRSLSAIELRVQQEEGKPAVITGYAALYNQPSAVMRTQRGNQFVETIMPGAFGDALSADVMARYNHQLILGRTSAGTLKLSTDARGLKYEITPSDSAMTDHVVKAIQRGDVKGSSFAFRTIADKWKVKDGASVRELHNVGLVDVGPVDQPAYPGTADAENAVTVRSLGTDEDAVDTAISKLDGVQQRYYYNSDATELTNVLRGGVDACRQMFDYAQRLIEKVTANRAQLTPEELAAANDLVDELNRCDARCDAALTAVLATGATGSAASPEDDAEDARRSQAPLLAARLNRRVELI